MNLVSFSKKRLGSDRLTRAFSFLWMSIQYENIMTQQKSIQIRALVHMMRLSNSLTVLSNTLVGVALAGILYPTLEIFPLIIAMILFYSAGMILNDVFDREIDARERPERPLPRGDISAIFAVRAGISFLVIGLVILFLYSWQSAAAGIVLVSYIIFYNYWHKNNPLSPVLMAACRMLVYVTAFAAFDFLVTVELVLSAIGLGVYIFGLTYYAKSTNKHHHIGYLIAGISLYDAVLLISLQAYEFAAVAVLCFFLTVLLQRVVKGT
jgi:4-hydroxybenzoate polyprenyltransferase